MMIMLVGSRRGSVLFQSSNFRLEQITDWAVPDSASLSLFKREQNSGKLKAVSYRLLA